MLRIPSLLGHHLLGSKKAEAPVQPVQVIPFRQLSLDEITHGLTAQGLELKTIPHSLSNEPKTYTGGIEVRANRLGVIGEFVHYQQLGNHWLQVYLPLSGLYQESQGQQPRGRVIERGLIEALAAVGSIRSGIDTLPEIATDTMVQPGRPFGKYFIVKVNPEGRLICPT